MGLLSGAFFFEINDLAEKKKVQVAAVSFAQDKVNWFRPSNNRKISSWKDLKSRMLEHFRMEKNFWEQGSYASNKTGSYTGCEEIFELLSTIAKDGRKCLNGCICDVVKGKEVIILINSGATQLHSPEVSR